MNWRPESGDNEEQNRDLLWSDNKQSLANHPDPRNICIATQLTRSMTSRQKIAWWICFFSWYLEMSFDEVSHTAIGHQRSHQPHLVRLGTWDFLEIIEKELPPYQQQRLKGKVECSHVETTSSFPPEINSLKQSFDLVWRGCFINFLPIHVWLLQVCLAL